MQYEHWTREDQGGWNLLAIGALFGLGLLVMFGGDALIEPRPGWASDSAVNVALVTSYVGLPALVTALFALLLRPPRGWLAAGGVAFAAGLAVAAGRHIYVSALYDSAPGEAFAGACVFAAGVLAVGAVMSLLMAGFIGWLVERGESRRAG